MNDFNLIDKESGEIYSANISLPEKAIKYHSIKRLNMKSWVEGLDFKRDEVCKSMLEVRIFNYIVHNLDRLNEFREVLRDVAQCLDTTPTTVSRTIKKMVDTNTIERIGIGVYRFNPFLVKAKGCINEDLAGLQKCWEDKYGVTEIKGK